MHRIPKSLLVTACLASALVMATTSLLAQEQEGRRGRGGGGGGQGFRGFPGGPLMLAGQKPVQDELKLSDEQRKKVNELAEKSRGAFRRGGGSGGGGGGEGDRAEAFKKMREQNEENAKQLDSILDSQQKTRLTQIARQFAGTRVFDEPEVSKALNLTDDQKEKLKTIREESRKSMSELGGGDGNREENGKKMREIMKTARGKAMDLLTEEQKTKFKSFLGEPFEVELPPPGRRNRST